MMFVLGLLMLCGFSHAQGPGPALRGYTPDSHSLRLGKEAPYLLERHGRRHLAVGGMVPLSCNDSFSSCVNWSDFIGTADRHSSLVTIPCGRCVIMDHEEDTLTLDGGLDIQGKLVFPNGYSGLTLRSTMIVVQGELEMASTGTVDGTPAVKFLMIGNSDCSFEPIGENAGYCGGRTCMAGKKAIMVAGGRVDIRGLPSAAKSWVKLYDVTDSGQSTSGIVVPDDGVLNHWGVGAEILITSYSYKGSDQEVRRIASYDTDYSRDGYVRLFLDSPISRPTTTRDDPDFAVEVALLSRNIVFEGGDDTTSFHGGHFWIFETNGGSTPRGNVLPSLDDLPPDDITGWPSTLPSISPAPTVLIDGPPSDTPSTTPSTFPTAEPLAPTETPVTDEPAESPTSEYNQRIEGVEIVNFGQAGNLGRYPLHAHLCGDLSGSVMAKNTIRQSNQRCVVIHGSDNLRIEDNIAYDTGGHCFMLEDGMETGNQFLRNLGAHTRRPGRVIPNMGSNGVETDDEPSTFWIPALGNTWVGNIAAGSTENGWWFEPMLRGPLAGNFPDWRPERINIERFEDNVAHSNGIGMKTYPQKGLRPQGEPNRFINFKVYRNQYKGLFAFFAHNLVIEGGIFADSSMNLDIDNCLNVDVYDVVIMGESDIYAQQITDQGLRVPCLQDTVVGLQLNTDNGRTGAVIHSASFSGFSATRCANEYPARLDNMAMSTDGIPGIGGGDPDTPDGDGDGGDGAEPGGGGVVHSLGDLPDGLFLNCGSSEDTVVEGSMWKVDAYFENGEAIQKRPSNPSNYNQYREQIGDSLDYLFPVNDGMYIVSLYWVEAEFRIEDAREFDVIINGETVLEDFDVLDEAGGYGKRIKKTFITTVSDDKELQISMVGTIDNAFVSLLSVQTYRTP